MYAALPGHRITDPEYVSLSCVYENKKKKARREVFPLLFQWLPESDLEMHLTSFHFDLRSGPYVCTGIRIKQDGWRNIPL